MSRYPINLLPTPGNWSSASTVLATRNPNDDEPPNYIRSISAHPFGGYYSSPSSTTFEFVPGADWFSSPPPLYRPDGSTSTTATLFDKCNNYVEAAGTATSSFPVGDCRAVGEFNPISQPIITFPWRLQTLWVPQRRNTYLCYPASSSLSVRHVV